MIMNIKIIDKQTRMKYDEEGKGVLECPWFYKIWVQNQKESEEVSYGRSGNWNCSGRGSGRCDLEESKGCQGGKTGLRVWMCGLYRAFWRERVSEVGRIFMEYPI